MKISQSQRLEQRQIISQRLQQSLRLLTLNNLEIEDAIEQEIETNPVLEWEPASFSRESVTTSPAERVENIDWQEYFESASSGTYFYEREDEVDHLATALYPPVTLAEHLIRQLEVSDLSGRDMELAVGIVSEEIGAGIGEAERVLVRIVQNMEPRGVGARDLREALLLQLGEDAPALTKVLIENYLEQTVAKSPAELAAKLKVAREEVEEAIDFIKSLEPRPGRDFGGEVNPSLTPDVRVELLGEKTEITLLDDRVGRLYISPRYRALLAGDGEVDDETVNFLKSRLTAAALFIRALHQRRRTLEKVIGAIFERQRDFLASGEAGLKPLTMEEVADQVGFHVSTISRAVAGKVADTPRGVFPLKYFFTGRVSASEGMVSVKRAKVVLEDIIDDEDKSSPLSDEELTAELSRRGIHVARRTVAKYRRELDIPSKHARKKNL
jgi:RNA polymerase sigma-54 factor